MSTPNPFAAKANKGPAASAPARPPQAAPPPVPGAGQRMVPSGVIAEIDLTGVSANNLMPNRKYDMALSGVETGETNAGDPKLIWKFKIIEEGPYYGRELQVHAALTEKAMFRTRQMQQALGVSGDNFRITEELFGIACIGEVRDSEFNGRTNSNLVDVYPWPEDRGGVGFRVQLP